MLVAYAIATANTARCYDVLGASGVLANFGGVPLAFIFIATLGTAGMRHRLAPDIGFNPGHGFSLYTFGGIAFVYMYFQIPLMVLVISPAFEGLRPAWREAAQNLGARPGSSGASSAAPC